MPIKFLEAMTASILSNGRKHGAFGMAGGGPGEVGKNIVVRASGQIEALAHIGQAEMQPGGRVRDSHARWWRFRHSLTRRAVA